MANSKEKKQALGRNAIYRTHKKQIHSYQDWNLPFLQFLQASLIIGRSMSHQHPPDSAESFALQSLCES
jgi:hypothetical protein